MLTAARNSVPRRQPVGSCSHGVAQRRTASRYAGFAKADLDLKIIHLRTIGIKNKLQQTNNERV